ncbi:MAG: tetratricopeptide repeat protein [Bacteroidia bacterium]|nr:tetratricopeptide repeat protein [Bacteroidia bacterium]
MKKVLYASAFFAILTLGFSLRVVAQGPGYQSYVQGENFRKQNNCRDAIQKYDEAIRLEPGNYKYYFQRGKCQYTLKDTEAAIQSFKNTVEYQQNFTPAYSLLAKIYKTENDNANAIFYYEQAAKFESNTKRKVQYQLLLVNLLLKEDRVYDAKRHIDEARRIDPDNPNILYYSAEIDLQDGRWDEARIAYEAAINSERLKTAPPAELAKYYYGLGLSLSNLGDAAGAQKAWTKANFGPYRQLIQQQMMKTNHVYFYKIAVSYYLNGEYRESESYIAKALELQKDFSSAFILKGKIAQKENNVRQAVQYYEQAINSEANPARKVQMYALIANLQLSNNDAFGAISTINQALQIDSKGSATLFYLKAKAEYDSGRFNDAINTLEMLLAAGVDTKSKAKYSFMLGMAAKKVSDYGKAKEAFKNALYGPYKPAAMVEITKIEERG